MKIRKIKISNFRGITHAEIDLSNFTTLVGPNNIGKSTILAALNIVLDNKKAKIEDWPGQTQSDDEMEITCSFSDLQEWEKAKPAISKLLDGENLHVKMKATWKQEADAPSCKYYVHHSLVTTPFTDTNFTDAKKNEFAKSVLDSFGITKAPDYNARKQELEEFVIANHPEQVESDVDWHEKGFANSLQQAIPHVMYVPASFKIEDDLKTTGTSPFAYLFKNKLFPKVKDDVTYASYIGTATQLRDKLKGQAEDGTEIEGLGDALEAVSNTLNEILDFDTKVKLAIGEIDVETLFMKAATFLIDEELETSLQYQGSGVQRALAFAMLESNATIEAQVEGAQRTTIVLYEEPELYIHPHLMRRLRDTLQTRSSSNEWQVICSTHSPFLIDLANKPDSIKLIKRGAGNSRLVSQLPPQLFEKSGEYDEKVFLRAVLDFHPTVCESLFAKRVIVVEGDTEVAVFSMIDELVHKLGITQSYHKDSTVVSAGGKWTIPAIVKVLKGLGIDYKVIHDTDAKGVPEDELPHVSNLHPYRANAKISEVAGERNVFRVNDTFEHVLWNAAQDNIKSSSKPYHSWKRTRQYLNGEITLDPACEATFKDIVEFAFCD
ncbi:ATP-dependent nuclease [Vibrio brasiliensis]|uniref:ATP-dependent nuclease n=1 Tax=Vibrio brasiliensis TaxID=170652 RepID=UPI001EFE8D17|nr:ATP-dependent endonuclease [Vibrio brasiliensis]MCG9725465.1 ATP-dependent endonuclease [Vibrio brasiliensis]